MTNKFSVIAGLVVLAAATGPAWAETAWVGHSVLTSVPAACQGSGAAVGDVANLIYRPASTALGNGANSSLAYISTRSYTVMTIAGNSFQQGALFDWENVSSRNGFYSSANFTAASVSEWVLTPASVEPATATPASAEGVAPSVAKKTPPTHVTLQATFDNFWGYEGCSIQMQAGLELIP